MNTAYELVSVEVKIWFKMELFYRLQLIMKYVIKI